MADNTTIHGGHQASPSPRRSFLVPMVLVLIFGGLFALGTIPRLRQTHEIDARAQSMVNDVPKVLVISPQPAVDAALVLPGSTEAIEDAQVGARTTGYISKRYVDIGAHVHAGQVLAEIESPDVDQQLFQANAQTAQSVATVSQSQADVANRQATVMQYRSSVRQAEATEEQARALEADSRAKLAQLQAAEKASEEQLGQAVATVKIKEAALKQAETSQTLAKVTYERYADLVRQGFDSLQDLDTNKAVYDNSKAAVTSAQADLDAANRGVDAAKANVDSAKANVISGEAEVKAAEKNVVAATAVVSAQKSTVSAGQSNVVSGQEVVKANRYAQIANEANSKRMAVLTSFEKVVAPFDGVITARNVDVGSLINAGSGSASGASSGGGTSASSTTNAGSASTAIGASNPAAASGLFGIARTDVLRILVSVPQAYAPLMRAGVPVRVTLSEFPGAVFPGTVSHVSGGLDTVSRTLMTEVHLPNESGKLLPGMYAQIAFDLPKTNQALRVPATAVTFDAKGTRVALVRPDNTIHYAAVREGRDFNTEVEIVQGLKPGDTLVESPSDDLADGQKIEPVVDKTVRGPVGGVAGASAGAPLNPGKPSVDKPK